jgi:hypothetical protein
MVLLTQRLLAAYRYLQAALRERVAGLLPSPFEMASGMRNLEKEEIARTRDPGFWCNADFDRQCPCTLRK